MTNKLLPDERVFEGLDPGVRVTYSYEQRGGYGFVRRVPATVVRRGAKLVTIEVDGSKKRISVHPWKLERKP